MGTRPIPGLILLTLPGKREKRFHWAPGKATLFLFATANRPKAPTTTKIIIKRSSATAEKQRISYASLSRLANWGQNYYIISGLGGHVPPVPPYGSAPVRLTVGSASMRLFTSLRITNETNLSLTVRLRLKTAWRCLQHELQAYSSSSNVISIVIMCNSRGKLSVLF